MVVASNLDYSGGPTPLPRSQMVILTVTLLSESMCATMLIPFVGLFVAFMQGWKAEEAGYASGFLIGLFMLGQVISCKAWSLLSDRHGRKIGIVLGISGSAVATLFFGLSNNIWECCFWRFVHGLFNGSSILSRTVIADITDKTNEAKGFMLITLTYGIGLLFGPTIGGFLYDPAHSSLGSALCVSSNGFLAQHPAFLPSLFISIYNVCASFGASLLLKETNTSAVPLLTSVPIVFRRYIACFLNKIQPEIPSESIVLMEEMGESSSTDGMCESSMEDTKTESSFGFKEAYEMSSTRHMLINAMLISAGDMLYAECFPLWGIAPRSVGGLGLESEAVGLLILANSVPAILANLVFPTVVQWYGNQLRFYQHTELAYAFFSFVVAFGSYFSSSGGFWFAMLMGVIRKWWESWCWCLTAMICAQLAPPGKVSMMYAVQQASMCIVRAVIPFLGAPLFAWSITGDHVFPFNHFLLFVLSAFPLLASCWTTGLLHLPESHQQVDSEPKVEVVIMEEFSVDNPNDSLSLL